MGGGGCVSKGGFPDLDLSVLFLVLSRPFWDFPAFCRIFPICLGHIVCDTVRTFPEKSRIETPQLTFSQNRPSAQKRQGGLLLFGNYLKSCKLLTHYGAGNICPELPCAAKPIQTDMNSFRNIPAVAVKELVWNSFRNFRYRSGLFSFATKYWLRTYTFLNW